MDRQYNSLRNQRFCKSMKLHESYMILKVLTDVLMKPIPQNFSRTKVTTLSQFTNPQLGGEIQNQIDTITR